MKNILVSIDFDSGAKLLLAQAKEMAKAFSAKVWIIHIAAPEPDFVGYSVGPQYIRDVRANELREEHRMLGDFAEKLISDGVDTEALLVQGATTDMVVKEAEKLKADLIICGHHERNFIYKALLGSVSDNIIRQASIPVLVVPMDQDDD